MSPGKPKKTDKVKITLTTIAWAIQGSQDVLICLHLYALFVITD